MKVFVALLVLKLTSALVCLDNRFECPDGHSCCRLTTGEQGCCPLPEAVCCFDGVHCCPHTYECDHRGFCTRGMEIVPMARKHKALVNKNFNRGYIVPMREIVKSMVTRKPETIQHNFQVATKMMPEVHTVEAGTVPMTNSEGLHHTTPSLNQKVPSHDDTITCPRWFKTAFCEHTLCCASRDGPWKFYGCCPYENGQCCGKGCCPSGDKCVEGWCQTRVTSLLFFEKHEM